MIKETLQTLEHIMRDLTEINLALDAALIVAITDQRGNITFANDKFCEISKYSRDELLGQNHRLINSGHHSKEFFRQMWRTIAHGQIWSGEVKNKAKDGSFYWMHTVIVPLLNERGKPYQYVSFRNEITARKLEEEKLNALIATMPAIVVFQDGEGRWLQANDAAMNLFSLDDEGYHGKCVSDLAAQYPTSANLLERFSATDENAWTHEQTQSEEFTIELPAGKTRTYQVTKVPVFHKDGQRSGLIVLGEDVTEQRKAEEALRRSETIAAIGQLASGIAHEVRNPLAAIKWAVQVLKSQHPDSSDQIDTILTELDRVDGIVGELLMVARPREKKYGFVRVQDILQSVLTLMTGHARKQRVEITLTTPDALPEIYCDPHQLKQVFINLIKNAVESMAEGGAIRIEGNVESEPSGNAVVVIQVIDEGSGIPDELIHRLGEPFITTKEKGTGLGLMVTQKIIADHGGTLSFTKRQPHGTIAEVRLPKHRP